MKIHEDDISNAFEAEGIDKDSKLSLDEMTKIAYNVFEKVIDKI